MPAEAPAQRDGVPITIAVDAMGGDHAPAEIVAGAVAAAAGYGLDIVLAGPPQQLRPLLSSHLAAAGAADAPPAPSGSNGVRPTHEAGQGNNTARVPTTAPRGGSPAAHGIPGGGGAAGQGPLPATPRPGGSVTVAERVRIVAAEDALRMDEGALASRRRARSSVAIACQAVRRGLAQAVVSAGSTGGIVTTARLRLRSQAGIMRPALAVVLPTRPSPTVLVDVGAIADPKPEMLVQFAHLGAAYAEVGCGIREPRVALLTIGAEPAKGNKLARRAHELLAGPPPHGGLPLRFVGNVEGGDLLSGKADVIVTDGFTGNVALKAVEGAAAFAARQLNDALRGSARARFGALFQRQALRELGGRMDAQSYGGAALLGLEATVVIAHGASTARGITSACRLAADLARGQINAKIRERLGPARGPHFLRRS